MALVAEAGGLKSPPPAALQFLTLAGPGHSGDWPVGRAALAACWAWGQGRGEAEACPEPAQQRDPLGEEPHGDGGAESQRLALGSKRGIFLGVRECCQKAWLALGPLPPSSFPLTTRGRGSTSTAGFQL